MMGSKFSSVCSDKTSVSTIEGSNPAMEAENITLVINEEVSNEAESRSTLQIVCAGLDEVGLNYAVLPEDETKPNDRLIQYGLKCECGLCRYILAIKESDDRFIVYVQAPSYVPTANRTQAALYLTYVNYGMTIGNFEMDLNDGEVRFKNTVDFQGSHLSVDMVKHMIGLPAAIMDRFFPGLMAVVYGSQDPKAAYDNVTRDMLGETVTAVEQ